MADLFINPDRILEIARSWIGTPYRHQHSLKGVGADCLGLLRGVWKELYGVEAEVPPPYTRDWAELRSGTGGEPMLEAAERNLHRIELAEVSPGDVVLIRVRPTALIKHCGIISETAPIKNIRDCPVHRLIHAYSLHAVTEDYMHSNWLDKEMHFFRFKEISEVVR
jgi:NlpC/P60 family putative phage cell wall peptidase